MTIFRKFEIFWNFFKFSKAAKSQLLGDFEYFKCYIRDSHLFFTTVNVFLICYFEFENFENCRKWDSRIWDFDENFKKENEGFKKEYEGFKKENEGFKKENEGFKKENEGFKKKNEN